MNSAGSFSTNLMQTLPCSAADDAGPEEPPVQLLHTCSAGCVDRWKVACIVFSEVRSRRGREFSATRFLTERADRNEPLPYDEHPQLGHSAE